MKVNVEIDEKYVEPNAVIYANQITEDIKAAVEFLKQENIKGINCLKNEQTVIVKLEEIEKIYALTGKVYLETKNETLEIRKRIYELEEMLPKRNFLRISNSEIINFDKVKNIELKIYGSLGFDKEHINVVEVAKLMEKAGVKMICVHGRTRSDFYSGKVTYASRRYIKKIKEFLKI